MDLSKIKSIYMIGIKGVGMTMLAEFLARQGYQVSGSDVAETFMTDAVLAAADIGVRPHFSASEMPVADLIVYSTAYSPETNEEVKAAFERKLHIVTYAEAMAEVFNTHSGIAVCGSHGKTTTTAWLGYVMHEAGLDPNVMVGARVPQFNGAGLTGSSNYLVIEADEYQNKFKQWNPKTVLLNNIEWDHPDFFPTPQSYEQAFADFIAKLPKSGVLVANSDDEAVRRVCAHSPAKVITYSFGQPADYIASEITSQNGKQFFKVSIGNDSDELSEDETRELGTFAISLPGKHNISNALAVIAACLEFGVELHAIRRHLESFLGTARRFERLGEFNGAVLIDDYAHHPTEIKATLDSARQLFADKKLRVVFHPHTFTRTKSLLKEFGSSLSGSDEVVVLDIYGSAREEQGGVSGQDVADEINRCGTKAVFKPTLGEAEQYLRETVKSDEVIVLMGAGDVFRIGERLVDSPHPARL